MSALMSTFQNTMTLEHPVLKPCSKVMVFRNVFTDFNYSENDTMTTTFYEYSKLENTISEYHEFGNLFVETVFKICGA